MNKFKLGDRVRVIDAEPEEGDFYRNGAVGTVVEVSEGDGLSLLYMVRFDGGEYNPTLDGEWYVSEPELEAE